MFGFFASAAVWAFLPSQRRARDDASMIPFRNDTAPKAGADARADQDAHQLKGQPHD
jgi:cytochrome c oxidase cbb3-type subunit 4